MSTGSDAARSTAGSEAAERAAAATPAGLTAVEMVLRRDRLLVIAALAAACLLCWVWIVPMARDTYGAMNGAAAWMRPGAWNLKYGALTLAMWTVMMAGMMLPSAAPTVLLFARVVRSHDSLRTQLRTQLFVCGYLALWTAFSLATTLLQWVLSGRLYVSPMLQLRSQAVSGALVLAAGVYQLTPAKRSCLNYCRSPASFITSWYRPGNRAALRMGLVHGLYCLGCCWALMLLLFAAGVMNLAAIAAITIFVLLEKVAPFGALAGRLSGLLLIACGAVMLLR